MNVVPIQAPAQESTPGKCPNCGAQIVADQRYCLTCGRPCSPVRLAFLDVLQAESESHAPATFSAPPAGYLPALQYEEGAIVRLRRYSGLFGLLAVLLVTGLIGLLVGHWLAPSKAPAAQVLKIEGLPVTGVVAGTVAGAASTPASSASTSAKAAASTSTPAGEAQEVKEAQSPKVKVKAPIKTSASTLRKLSSSKGKAHQQEIEKLTAGDKPIETGG